MQQITPVPTPESSKGQANGRIHKEQRKYVTAKQSRTMLLQFAVSAAILTALVIVLTVVLDPLQFYHKSFYPAIYSNEERYQNPGLAKNYDYDTIIIGTSMTENFLPSVVNGALGGKTMKLSVRGSTADEHHAIASIALETGKVKKVLWGLDYFSLKLESKEEGNNPEYLYDDKWWNDYKYWLNYSVYQNLFIEGILRPLRGLEPRQLEDLYNWNDTVTFGAKQVVEDYRTSRQSEVYFGLNEEPIDTIKKVFHEQILALVKKYPDVEFNFYYPPYSILRQKVWQDTNNTRFLNQLEMKEWIFEQLDPLPNVTVYDFQEESDWTYNLDLYKDLSHHNQDVNSWIAEAIGREDAKYKVTQDNVAQFTLQMEKQLTNIAITSQNKVVNVEFSLLGKDQTTPLTFTTFSITDDEQDIFVPVKEMIAALRVEMVWDQADKSLSFTRGDLDVVLRVGSMEAETSNGTKEIAFAPQIIKGTTMVPLASVSELLGYESTIEQTSDDHIMWLKVSATQ